MARVRSPLPLLSFAAVACLAAPAFSQTVRLKDGRNLTGRVGRTTSVAENPDQPTLQAGEVATRPILVIDDELRRVFVPKMQVVEVPELAVVPPVRIAPWQNPCHGAAKIVSVGPALGIAPFDEFGRRIYEMQFEGGRLAVVQGITELTPYYAKVEALMGPERVVTWDMRIATSSIPRDTLAKILTHAIPQNDGNARLQAVRFYAQAKRFHEARAELDRIIEEFPALKALQTEAAQLKRLAAQSLLDELELRRAAGQHKLVQALLRDFPVDQVSGETLVKVRDLTGKYEAEDARIRRIGQTLQETVAAMENVDHRGMTAPIAAEIVKELTHNNVDRLAPFVQLLDDPAFKPDDKVALAVSGWLLGPADADRNLPIALSLVKVRDAVIRYLREPLAAERAKLLETISHEEGASVERLAKIISHMKPPWHDPAQAADADGFLELSAPGQTEDGDFRYQVQLPAEYDPYRRYPTLVVLNGAYNSPEQELNFWAGEPPEPGADGKPAARRGQAMRYGYITLAIDWQKPHQYEYEYSGREHIAVLTALRDATRRFSIDADRVYITGHDVGGEAAWDLAQAHPDLWAGAIPFVALAEKYSVHYWKNGRYVPMYFVAGELDGGRTAENAPVWDRYLRTPPQTFGPGPEDDEAFDVTVVEYKGRGHEPFHDEILNLFDWMSRRSRGTPPKEFECDTLRPWDNFFWWLECDEFPPQFMIHPTEWSGQRAKPASVQGKIQADNRLWAKSAAAHTTLWLTPDIVDFSKPIRVTFNNNKLVGPGAEVKPDSMVLLEDVRTRGDRQRPFWAKVESP